MRFRRAETIILLTAVCFGSARCDGERSPTEPTPVCSIAIAPASLTFASEGGTGGVTVTTPAACTWSVTGSAPWITITAGSTGSGPGSVAYSVAPNPATESRSGSLTVGGQTHAVTQQGRPATVCIYDLSPGSAEFGKDAATGIFAVSAPGDCAWSATTSAPWVVVTSGSHGSGSGSVAYAVARNADAIDRSATITVADKTFTVRQAGDVGGCQYSVVPVAFSPCMPGGNLSATLMTQAGCPWTVAPSASWLSIPSGSSSTGSGAITITFSDNYDAPREGIVMVRWPTPTAGQNIRVAQAGCLYAVSRSAFSFTASAGSGTFDVIQQSEPNTCGGATQDRCVWTAVSDVSWITITSTMPRSGDNPVAFTVATNDAAASRVGRIAVRDKVVVITQTGR
jgi:hypothetical protein